jgi:hypothetical protein
VGRRHLLILWLEQAQELVQEHVLEQAQVLERVLELPQCQGRCLLLCHIRWLLI